MTGPTVVEVPGVDDLRDPAASLFPYAPPDLGPGDVPYKGRGLEPLRSVVGKCDEIENSGGFGLSIVAGQRVLLVTVSSVSYIYASIVRVSVRNTGGASTHWTSHT